MSSVNESPKDHFGRMEQIHLTMDNNMSHTNKSKSEDDSGDKTKISKEVPSFFQQIASALVYFSASFLITVVNKVVLTSYSFPSFQFVCVLQLLTTVVALWAGKQWGFIHSLPSVDFTTFKKLYPLPLLFFGNAVTGLGGTQSVSLPMHTVLRRFAILMTMVAEFYVLGVKASCAVQISVYMMIIGALVAFSKDLTFSMYGYVLVTTNNVLTAVNAVYIKKKLEVTDLGHYGLMYCNAFFMLIPAIILAYILGDFDSAFAYSGWGDLGFLINFILACGLGVVLNTSMVLCTHYNSALTTIVVGCLKNIFVTYLGMFIGGDYVFDWTNFMGINISVVGSLIYAWVTFKPPSDGNQLSIK